MTELQFYGILLGSVIGIVLSIFIVRAIFSIDQITNNLEKQTKLLNEIARQIADHRIKNEK